MREVVRRGDLRIQLVTNFGSESSLGCSSVVAGRRSGARVDRAVRVEAELYLHA